FQSLSTGITNHELFINGIDMGVIETLAGANWTPGFGRNAFVRIDGTGGTLITSIAFQNLTALDVLMFDHLAIDVPEPASALPATSALLWLGLRLRRRAA